MDSLAAGEGGAVQGHGDQIAHVDVPGPGDNLHLLRAHVRPADPHVVAVRVAFHGRDPARHHMGDLRTQILGALHLGPGEGHGLGEFSVVNINLNKLVEPFS